MCVWSKRRCRFCARKRKRKGQIEAKSMQVVKLSMHDDGEKHAEGADCQSVRRGRRLAPQSPDNPGAYTEE
jgi:hypothetical protein